MNEYDIERGLSVISERAPQLRPYAKLLSDWCDTVNAHSDGWAYWKGGTRPAARLMELVQSAVDKLEYRRDGELPTAEQMRRTLPPIKAAATRHKMAFPDLEAAAAAPHP